MHADLKYVESLEKEIDELESGKAKFSNMYDMILQEYVSNEVMCSYLLSLSDLDALAELQCLYLHKVKQCDCIAQKLSKQTESVKREQYIEIQDLKAQLQDKNIAISELKKLIEKGRGKSVETKFDKPSVVRQPNAQQIPKPSVLGVNHKTNVSRPQHRSNQLKYKVMPNNSQVKVKKTQVEDHPRIPSISNKIKSVTTCNDSLNFRTSNIVQPILFIVDSGCTKHMTGNLKLLCSFVEKYMGTIHFDNDQFALILGYGDLVQGNIMINGVYYVKGLNHNLFLVGQFCDADLEVAFQKSTCFVRDLQASPTQAWLWHQRLSHLNFDYINLLSKKDVVIGLLKLKYVKDQLCSSCEVSKAKRSSFKSRVVPSSKGRLNFLYMDLCGPMRVASINRKKYILGIVDDYSRYTWTLFLRSKDETPESMGYRVYNKRTRLIVESIYIRFDEIKEMSKTFVANDTSGLVPKRQKALSHLNFDYINLLSKKDVVIGQPKLRSVKDQLCSSCKVSKAKRSSFKSKAVPSLKGRLNLFHMDLCGPMRVASINGKKYILENNDNQAEEEHLQDDEFTNPFCTLVQEVAESSSHNIGLQIHQSPRGIFINQAKYALEILHKHGMKKGQSIGTPMATKPKLDADLSGNPVDQTDYRSKIRSLMYLISSRPDIVQADCTAMSSAEAEYMALSASYT
nr:hypothetical protein [Tanacetum cinerariifolium]